MTDPKAHSFSILQFAEEKIEVPHPKILYRNTIVLVNTQQHRGIDFLSNTQNVEFKGYDNGLSTLYPVGLFCMWVIQ